MTEQIVINDVPEEKSLEQTAADMGLLDEAPAPEGEITTTDRPEWLPEKFSSPAEMAKAYAELEAKMGRQGQPAKERSEEPQNDTPSEAPSEAEARQRTQDAGIDFDGLSREYYENQGLSEETYEKLESAGIPRRIVDQFISGQEASAEVQRSSIINDVGGSDHYNDMINWASDNLTSEEIAAYNNTVTSGDTASVRMAVAGLNARFQASQGNEPQRMVAGESAGDSVYRSNAELVKDMSDPRYHNDPAYRADVMRKLERSDIM